MNNIKRFIPMIPNITKRYHSNIPKEYIQREILYISDGESIKSYLKNISNDMIFNKDTYYQVSIKTFKQYNKLSRADIYAIEHAYCGCVKYDEETGRLYFK